MIEKINEFIDYLHEHNWFYYIGAIFLIITIFILFPRSHSEPDYCRAVGVSYTDEFNVTTSALYSKCYINITDCTPFNQTNGTCYIITRPVIPVTELVCFNENAIKINCSTGELIE